VATESTGIEIRWNGVLFREVTGYSISFSGPREDRNPAAAPGWIGAGGKVTVECLELPVAIDKYGVLGTLIATGGGVSWNGPAFLDGMTVTPELNGVTRYTLTLSTVN
jgi:hypothetical protein